MSRDDEILLDIVNALKRILAFSKGMKQSNFLQDEKTQSSVLYQIVILGEAVNRLSDEFKEEHSQIPFDEIRGMRNRLVHEYRDVDYDVVWNAVRVDIPELLDLLLPFVQGI